MTICFVSFLPFYTSHTFSIPSHPPPLNPFPPPSIARPPSLPLFHSLSHDRGCYECPLYPVGEHPTYLAKAAERQERKRNRKLAKEQGCIGNLCRHAFCTNDLLYHKWDYIILYYASWHILSLTLDIPFQRLCGMVGLRDWVMVRLLPVRWTSVPFLRTKLLLFRMIPPIRSSLVKIYHVEHKVNKKKAISATMCLQFRFHMFLLCQSMGSELFVICQNPPQILRLQSFQRFWGQKKSLFSFFYKQKSIPSRDASMSDVTL